MFAEFRPQRSEGKHGRCGTCERSRIGRSERWGGPNAEISAGIADSMSGCALGPPGPFLRRDARHPMEEVGACRPRRGLRVKIPRGRGSRRRTGSACNEAKRRRARCREDTSGRKELFAAPSHQKRRSGGIWDQAGGPALGEVEPRRRIPGRRVGPAPSAPTVSPSGFSVC